MPDDELQRQHDAGIIDVSLMEAIRDNRRLLSILLPLSGQGSAVLMYFVGVLEKGVAQAIILGLAVLLIILVASYVVSDNISSTNQ